MPGRKWNESADKLRVFKKLGSHSGQPNIYLMKGSHSFFDQINMCSSEFVITKVKFSLTSLGNKSQTWYIS